VYVQNSIVLFFTLTPFGSLCTLDLHASSGLKPVVRPQATDVRRKPCKYLGWPAEPRIVVSQIPRLWQSIKNPWPKS
jgi:hypothetical protein